MSFPISVVNCLKIKLNKVKKLHTLTILSFLNILCLASSFAKSGVEHYSDMLDIFPFTQESFNHKVIDLYYAINSYLDEPNWEIPDHKRPIFVCNDNIFSQISWANHRIWFHWGLSDPKYPSKSLSKSFEPLKRMVYDKLIKYDDRNRFWNALQIEEHDRLKVIYEKATIAFGYNPTSINNMQHNQIWAFATILYSIHILGDLTTTAYKIVRAEDDVRNDIFNSIKILGGFDNKQAAESLITFLKQEAPISSSSTGTSMSSAQKLIDALKDKNRGFSQFILACKGVGYNYKQRFKDAKLITK